MGRKIGLLGGTFDPPHLAHLIIAEEVRTKLQLDEVWFIPVYLPPHKTRDFIASAEDRLEMVKRAIESNPHFSVSTIELERKGPSYTIDTVKELRGRYPDTSFYFIIGGDMSESLHTWKSIEELKQLVTFVAVERPGFQWQKNSEELLCIEIPTVDISSTEIRWRAKNKETIRYFVPEKVRKYIEERSLYG